MGKIIIVFDGFCVLCNKYVAWLAKKDVNKSVRFTDFNSNFIKENYPSLKLGNTLYVISDDQQVLEKSKAVKYILEQLKIAFLVRLCLHFSPVILSNFFYNLVASNRYNIFGKYDSCPMPSTLVKDRILE